MAPVILPRFVERPGAREPLSRRVLTHAVLAGTAGIALAVLAGFAGRLCWGCELACHFQVQYLWGLLPAAAILAGLRKYRLALVPGFVALVTLIQIVPLYAGRGAPAADAKVEKLRILSLNVHVLNREHGLVCDYVLRKTPDVAVFYEVSETWADQLTRLDEHLPYNRTSVHPENGTFGLAIYSRHPLFDVEFPELGNGNRAVLARMNIDSKSLTLLGAHPHSPKSPRGTERRNQELRRLAEVVAEQHDSVILVGDLNTTSWSPAFGDLVRATGLADTRRGFGVEATWPAEFGRFGITIDHCLVSPEIKVRRHAVGEDVRSDHLPIIVDLFVNLE